MLNLNQLPLMRVICWRHLMIVWELQNLY